MHAEVVGVALLGPEGESAHGRVQSVGAHDQVVPARFGVFEGDPDAVLILVERGHAVPEHEAGAPALRAPALRAPALRGPVVQDPDEVVAQQLDVVAVEPPAADGALGGAVELLAVAVQDGHAPHPGAVGAGSLQHAEPLGHLQGDAPDVHGLPAAAQPGGPLHHRGGEAPAAQQCGERGAGDAAAGDEHGLHGSLLAVRPRAVSRAGTYAVRGLNVRRTCRSAKCCFGASGLVQPGVPARRSW